MTLIKFAALALAVLATNVTPVFSDEPQSDDATKMKGVWIAEKVTSSGRTVPADKFPFELHFENAKLIFKFVGEINGKDRVHEITIDPTKTPKTIDITRKIRDTEETVRGIYKFDGNKLMICSLRGPDRKPSPDRPTTFDSSKTVKSDLLVLKLKPDDAAEAKSLKDATEPTDEGG